MLGFSFDISGENIKILFVVLDIFAQELIVSSKDELVVNICDFIRSHI